MFKEELLADKEFDKYGSPSERGREAGIAYSKGEISMIEVKCPYTFEPFQDIWNHSFEMEVRMRRR